MGVPLQSLRPVHQNGIPRSYNTVKMTVEIDEDRMEGNNRASQYMGREIYSYSQTGSKSGSACFSEGSLSSRILEFLKTFTKRENRQIPPSLRQDIAWWNPSMREFNRELFYPQKSGKKTLSAVTLGSKDSWKGTAAIIKPRSESKTQEGPEVTFPKVACEKYALYVRKTTSKYEVNFYQLI